MPEARSRAGAELASPQCDAAAGAGAGGVTSWTRLFPAPFAAFVESHDRLERIITYVSKASASQ